MFDRALGMFQSPGSIPFNPSQLFAALQGAWLEPKQGYIWQENTGVTPTTTGGQTIGLMLDQSQGAVLGAEKAPTGTTADFTATGTASIVGSAFNFPATNDEIRANCGSEVIDRWYAIEWVVSGTAGQTVNIALRNYTVGNETSSTFTLTGGQQTIRLYRLASANGLIRTRIQKAITSTATSVTFISYSVREVLGNHAYQSVSGSRPTLQFSGALPLARFDATDSLVVSLPNLGGGIFSASGSVYFATPVGMSQIDNLSMGTTYTLPALSSDIYSWMVFPQRLNSSQENKLAQYMQQKAGIAGPDYFEQVDYGPELVVNGGFDTDSDWTKGAGWTIGAGAASFSNLTGTLLSQSGYSFIAGRAYEISFDLIRTGVSLSVDVRLSGGGGSVASPTFTSAGRVRTVIIADINRPTLNFLGYSTGVPFSIDNISVRELKDGVTGQLSDDAGDLIFTAQ